MTAAAKKRNARRAREESGAVEPISGLVSEFDDLLGGKGVRRTRQRSKATKRASRAIGYDGGAGAGGSDSRRRRAQGGRGASVRGRWRTLRVAW